MRHTRHAQTPLPGAHTRTLVVADPAVEGWQGLVEDLQRTTAVLVLDPHADGLQQLSRWLGNLRAPLHSIHLIGHGRPGSMRLGCSALDLASLQNCAPQWQRVGHALDGDGALVLYGCDLAKGPAGRQFVDALAVCLGVEVTASSRRVGAQALGGDGAFDHYTGKSAAPAVRQPSKAGLAGRANPLQAGVSDAEGIQAGL